MSCHHLKQAEYNSLFIEIQPPPPSVTFKMFYFVVNFDSKLDIYFRCSQHATFTLFNRYTRAHEKSIIWTTHKARGVKTISRLPAFYCPTPPPTPCSEINGPATV